MNKITSFFLLLTVFLSSCDKRPFDYRNKFTGYYQFEFTVTTWDANLNDTTTDIIKMEGSVDYDKKGPRDEIKISISGLQQFTVTIDKDGTISSCGGSGKIENKRDFIFDYNTMLCSGVDSVDNIVYHIEGNFKEK